MTASHPPPLQRSEFAELARFIAATLPDVDAITLGRQRRVAVRTKQDGSEVTEADRAAERLLRRRIRAAWPRDSILGEEYGGEITARGRTWLIDPIDGTASYVLGLGTFGTLLAVLVDSEPVFGCIHLPAMGETTFAGSGCGCWLWRGRGRARRVRVAAPRGLAVASVGLTSFKASDLSRRPGPWRISALARAVGRVRLVGDCVQYALLCRGALDAAIDPRMSAWDIAPLVVCVREAGGSVGELGGGTRGLLQASSLVAASSPGLRRAICARLMAPRVSR